MTEVQRSAGARSDVRAVRATTEFAPPAASARPMASFEIPSLNGIRALSFGLVFLSHVGLEWIVPGGFGVTVFFVLSGYLITTLLRVEQERTGTVSLRRFYSRRALRILPPLYVVLAIGVALAVAAGDALSWWKTAAQALHVGNFAIIAAGSDGMARGTGVIWSLAIEEHFYLLFPVLYLALLRLVPDRNRQAALLLLLCLAILAWRCVLVFALEAPADRTYYGTDTRADAILYGCLLAVWSNPALDASRFDERSWKRVLLPGALLLLLGTFVVRSPEFRESLRYSIQGIALLPLLSAAVRFPGWGPFGVLQSRVLHHVALLSYTLYLVHYVVIQHLERALRLPGVVTAVLALVVSLGIAQVVYVAIERPCATLRRRLS
jgi:peptidoglycan/LPS O-acetylase OafA/YrhL